MWSPEGRGLRVAVLGAGGYIGSRLVERLAGQAEVERVLALDVKPLSFESPKVKAFQRDATQPLADLLQTQPVESVVPLAFLLRPSHRREAVRRVNVGGMGNLLAACEGSGVRHVLYLSSTTVYGAHPDNCVLLKEDAPLRPVKGFQYAEDKVAAEELLRRFAEKRPEVCVTVLRGCVVMGHHATNFIAQALGRRTLVGVAGHDPPMQFLHERDVVDIMLYLLLHPQPGVFNVAGEGTVPYSDLARLSGQRMLWLPAWLLYPLTEWTWRLRLQGESPACGLDFVRWPWVASTEKLRQEVGIAPRYASREALEAFVMGIHRKR